MILAGAKVDVAFSFQYFANGLLFTFAAVVIIEKFFIICCAGFLSFPLERKSSSASAQTFAGLHTLDSLFPLLTLSRK